MIMVDQKRLKNPNGLILGTPGSDEVLLNKRKLQTFLITEDDIIVCDPEARYSGTYCRHCMGR